MARFWKFHLPHLIRESLGTSARTAVVFPERDRRAMATATVAKPTVARPPTWRPPGVVEAVEAVEAPRSSGAEGAEGVEGARKACKMWFLIG